MHRYRISVAVLLIFMVSMIDCSSKDPVSLLMAELEAAAEARDVDGFEHRLDPGFSGNGSVSREEALAMLRRNFAAYERISLDITNVERSKSGDRLNFRVDFLGQANTAFNLQNLLPSTAAYQFELQLVEKEGTLMVQKAFWTELSTP